MRVLILKSFVAIFPLLLHCSYDGLILTVIFNRPLSFFNFEGHFAHSVCVHLLAELAGLLVLLERASSRSEALAVDEVVAIEEEEGILSLHVLRVVLVRANYALVVSCLAQEVFLKLVFVVKLQKVHLFIFKGTIQN